MKIALVCPYNMFDSAGGVADLVVHLHDGRKKRGHTVKIITPRPSSSDIKQPPEDYILLGNISGNRFSAGLGTAGTWTFDIDSDEVAEAMDREKFDVINFHEPWAPILARQILQHSNSAHVGTFHANLFDSAAGKSLVNLFVPYAKGVGEKLDLVTAVSPAPAAVILEKGGPDHRLVQNIRYIPNGIDLKKYSKRPALAVKHPQIKTILHVGRLEGRKGIKYLLRAYSQLAARRDDVQLMIAGKGPEEQKLRDFVDEQKIPRVTFLGYISEADKIYHLHRADVFCSAANRGESFGIVLLEAMAAGTPIVAGDNIGYIHVMRDTGAISLVNPKDIVDFSRRLEIMLFNNDIQTVWLKWAKKYIKNFDYPRIIDQYLDAYKEAIALHENKPAPKRRYSLR
jgi:phosphatidyl-myo-inositol alpha-mannosyltransferase